MKILISGGHLTPALAFIDYVRAHGNDEIVFAGRKFAQFKTLQPTQEQSEVEKRGVKFIEFHAGKFSQDFLKEIYTFGRSLSAASQIVSQEKPDVFLSFGGYLAVPLAISCFLARVPIVTHEQTRTAGLANTLIGWLAKKVAISYPDTAHHFSSKKVVLTGNPIRPMLFGKAAKHPEWLPIHPHLPILCVTGGSQGSLFINQLIAETLPQLTKEWCVIHQSGASTPEINYGQFLAEAKHALPEKQQHNYFFREWLSENDLGWIYKWAAVFLSRAGANTVQEITLAAKPAFFIPLPIARHREQHKNAAVVVADGAAISIDQEKLTPEVFFGELHVLKQKYYSMLKHARTRREHFILDAEEKLYAVLLQASSRT
jgi:UDP-N-acetylglucosamine--N-acetylmuramyl-(pentapeptide) pyrophosphoryl-undecaprenol N-acetylglucosamine transferase